MRIEHILSMVNSVSYGDVMLTSHSRSFQPRVVDVAASSFGVSAPAIDLSGKTDKSLS